MLVDERRRPDLVSPQSIEAEGRANRAHGPLKALGYMHDHAKVANLRIIDHGGNIVNGREWRVEISEPVDPGDAVAAQENLIEGCRKSFVIVDAAQSGGKTRVSGEFRRLDRLNERC